MSLSDEGVSSKLDGLPVTDRSADTSGPLRSSELVSLEVDAPLGCCMDDS